MDPTPAPGSEALRLAPTIQPMEFGTAGHDKIHEPVVEPATDRFANSALPFVWWMNAARW